MEQHLRAIRDILVGIGEQVEGNLICDVHPDNLQIHINQEKISNLQSLAKGKQRICEIGINAGHSLLLMLDVNPTATYVLFDLGYHRYTRPCVEYIRSVYPSTSIRVIYGDSKTTVPQYNGSFDFIHIDGGHELPEVTSDYNQAIRLIEPNCPIIFDDYDYPTIYRFLIEKLNKRNIVAVEQEYPTPRHLIFISRA
jgi:predicted O-methyltransferase YrrM